MAVFRNVDGPICRITKDICNDCTAAMLAHWWPLHHPTVAPATDQFHSARRPRPPSVPVTRRSKKLRGQVAESGVGKGAAGRATPDTPASATAGVPGLLVTFELRRTSATRWQGKKSWLYRCRAATRTPRDCWSEQPHTDLAMHSARSVAGRCEWRHATLREAQAVCARLDWCGGVTRDSGLECGGSATGVSR